MFGFESPLKAIMEMRTMVKQTLEWTKPLQSIALAQEAMKTAQVVQRVQIPDVAQVTQNALDAHRISRSIVESVHKEVDRSLRELRALYVPLSIVKPPPVVELCPPLNAASLFAGADNWVGPSLPENFFDTFTESRPYKYHEDPSARAALKLIRQIVLEATQAYQEAYQTSRNSQGQYQLTRIKAERHQQALTFRAPGSNRRRNTALILLRRRLEDAVPQVPEGFALTVQPNAP
jgi:predicted RNA polymerase sigma factor